MNNRMKQKYEAPKLEIMFYSADDVITTSGFIGEFDEFSRPHIIYEEENKNSAYTMPKVNINE